jgi:Pyruvate/2-oxoacid:ferredoxin oxidoreductase delta subunit
MPWVVEESTGCNVCVEKYPVSAISMNMKS